MTSKENDYVIMKVINFVLDSPARKMKAKNKIMYYLYFKNNPTALMFENNQILYMRFQCIDVYGCPKLLDMGRDFTHFKSCRFSPFVID